jgi:hypothetical protein
MTGVGGKPATVKIRRFTKPGFLRLIGPTLLEDFFERFRDELTKRRVELPEWNFDNTAYFKSVAAMVERMEELPGPLVEALYGIEAMANEEGQERLERAVEDGTLRVTFREESTHAEIAVQAWLANPNVFARKLRELRLFRLSAFDYFSSRMPVEQRRPFPSPDEAGIGQITSDIDGWFRRRNRGQGTSYIEVFRIDGEFWFLIRHGDTYKRMPAAAEDQKVEVVHFRPLKDDVVIYSPRRDEIRIHAGTYGECQLYRQVFGARLFGHPGYFSESKTYTLEPLRVDGRKALVVGDLPIRSVVLRELEIAWEGSNGRVVLKRDDIFSSIEQGSAGRLPARGRLVRAAFDFYLCDSFSPRKVQIRLPNSLRVGRHCDTTLVHEWMTARGFRVSTSVEETPHVELLGVS